MTSINFSKILPHLIHDFVSEHDLIKAIQELSTGFTKERNSITKYLTDERLVAAYSAFYFLTNLPKLEETLKWMPNEWRETLRSCAFVDMGSGPGTFSVAWRLWLGSQTPGIVQIESSALMRLQAERLWAGLFPDEKLKTIAEIKVPKLLFFGHSANEMGYETVLRYIQDISPDHILFVEPGTKDFFPTMLTIRQSLIEDGYQILFPCPTAAICPMQNSTQDWCHQFMQIKQDSEIERISQMAKKDRRNLPIIVHAFSRTFQKPAPEVRVVRVFPETKFSYEWEVCQLNQLQHFQVMKRGLDKKSTDELSSVLSGAALEIEVEKTLENGQRVRVKKIN